MIEPSTEGSLKRHTGLPDCKIAVSVLFVTGFAAGGCFQQLIEKGISQTIHRLAVQQSARIKINPVFLFVIKPAV